MPPPIRAGKGLGDEEENDFHTEFYLNNPKLLSRSRDLMGSPTPSQQFVPSLYSQPSSGLGVSGLGLQPPGSLSTQAISRGFGSPTGGFPSSSLPPRSLAPQPAPGAPSRGLLPFESRSGLLTGPQTRLSETKRTTNQLGAVGASSMGGLSMAPGRILGSHGVVGAPGFHNPLGSGGDANTPSILDLSEFPSLSTRTGPMDVGVSSHHNPMAGRAPYVGMVKQPTSESSEFTMSSEDFPALPGSQNADNLSIGDGKTETNDVQGGTLNKGETGVSNRAPGAEKSQAAKRGIQTSPDGKVSNIPGGMVTDQFGMVGLLTFIRAADSDPNLVALALGCDLTTLGLNLNQPENLLNTFGGPWSEYHCQPHNIDYNVPSEYLINSTIRDKLAHVKLQRYGEDLLFYLFYTNLGDALQIAAALELYNRDWRYHKEERVWITRAPGCPPVDKTETYERGTYYFFDATSWRRVAKEFHLEYDKLEGRPQLPGSTTTSTAPAVL